MGFELGRYLRTCRRKAKKSQSEVARDLGYGSPQFISNVERGISYPPLESCGKWFDSMGASRNVALDIWVKEFKQQMWEMME